MFLTPMMLIGEFDPIPCEHFGLMGIYQEIRTHTGHTWYNLLWCVIMRGTHVGKKSVFVMDSQYCVSTGVRH